MRKTASFVALVLLLLLGVTPVLAAGEIPKLPHAFFGSVLVNGASASNGTQISATVNIGTIISTQNPVTTIGGNYGIGSPYLLVQGYDIPDGATITFRVTNANGTATVAVPNAFLSGGGPTSRNLSVTIASTPTPTISGGGGGVAAPTPTVFAVDTTFFGSPVSFSIGIDGRVQNTVTMTSPDGKLTMTIPAGTIARDRNGVRLTSLTATVNASPPPPPSGASIIGLAYDFGPNGATFNPPATFTYTYSQNDIPQGVAEESLVLAFYDEQASKWVELPGRVDTVNNTITASIPHFTSFAIIGKPKPAAPPATVVAPPAPAAFSLSNLSIQPAQVKPGETVTINVSALNSGGTGGSYTVILNVNGVKEAEKSVTVAAGGSQAVTFSVTRKEPGTYTVTVDGLSTSFVVSAPELQPPPQLNWTLLGGLMVAAIVVALAFILALARRRGSR